MAIRIRRDKHTNTSVDKPQKTQIFHHYEEVDIKADEIDRVFIGVQLCHKLSKR